MFEHVYTEENQRSHDTILPEGWVGFLSSFAVSRLASLSRIDARCESPELASSFGLDGKEKREEVTGGKKKDKYSFHYIATSAELT